MLFVIPRLNVILEVGTNPVWLRVGGLGFVQLLPVGGLALGPAPFDILRTFIWFPRSVGCSSPWRHPAARLPI